MHAKLLTVAAFLCLAVPAHADLSFTFDLNPKTSYAHNFASFDYTLANTGTEDLFFDLYATNLRFGTIEPYVTGMDFFPPDRIDVGEVLTGVWALGFDNVPAGSYTLFRDAVLAYDAGRYQVRVPAPSPITLIVNEPPVGGQVPEPSSFMLLGTGLVVAAGLLRKRLH